MRDCSNGGKSNAPGQANIARGESEHSVSGRYAGSLNGVLGVRRMFARLL